MKVRMNSREGKTWLAAYSDDRRDQQCYATTTIDANIEALPKGDVVAIVESLRQKAAENYAKKHLPRGYTVSKEEK